MKMLSEHDFECVGIDINPITEDECEAMAVNMVAEIEKDFAAFIKNSEKINLQKDNPSIE